MLHSSLTFRIIFTQGLKFPKNIWANFLQIPITEVKICFKNTKNAFNKYRKRYPCFVYLRKICYNKGRFILKQRIFGIFFYLNFCSNKIAKKLSFYVFFFRIILHFFGCIMSNVDMNK